jgi:5'-nucleotidase
MTNDDGADSPGILLLADALRSAGHRVIVVAPDRNRSGFSHAITLGGDVDIKEIGRDLWVCRGTPADCVFVLMKGGFLVRPDMVISGINAGENLGTDLIYSATAGGARQGALYCDKSLALSLAGYAPYYWDEAVGWVMENLDMLAGYCEKDVFLNVNMPNAKEMRFDGRLTFPSRRKYYDTTRLEPPGEDGWQCCKMVLGKIETSSNADSDWTAVTEGRVSVSKIYVYPVGVT